MQSCKTRLAGVQVVSQRAASRVLQLCKPDPLVGGSWRGGEVQKRMRLRAMNRLERGTPEPLRGGLPPNPSGTMPPTKVCFCWYPTFHWVAIFPRSDSGESRSVDRFMERGDVQEGIARAKGP